MSDKKHPHLVASVPVRRGLVMATVGMLVLSGCSNASGGTDGETPAENLTLDVAFPADVENYDPHQRPQTISRTISRNIADTLVDQDPETGEIVPWLAESWEVNEDQSEFTFHLRDDVTFSDGTEFTAESVKNNFDRIIDIGPLAFIGASHLRGYEGAEIIDDHTVTVSFDGPNAQFLQAASTQPLSILADATLELDPEEVARGEVIGSGPYVLEDYRPNEGITLTARDDYAWGSDAYENQGPAAFGTVEISFVPDPSTQAGSVSSSQVDFAGLLDDSALQALQGGNAELEVLPNVGIAFPLVPYYYSDIFQDENVRKALNSATDREEVAERIYGGSVNPATGVLTEPTPGSADFSEELAHDPDKAIELLEDAGWTDFDDDGTRVNQDGERLEIEIRYTGSGTTQEALFQLLQSQWAEVGIDFVLTPVTQAQSSEWTIHDSPADITTWSQGRADPDVLRVVYSSFYENQSFFYGGAIEEIDDALLELQNTTDADEREEASRYAQELLIDGGWVVPLIDAVTVSAYGDDVASISHDIENKAIFTEFVPSE